MALPGSALRTNPLTVDELVKENRLLLLEMANPLEMATNNANGPFG